MTAEHHMTATAPKDSLRHCPPAAWRINTHLPCRHTDKFIRMSSETGETHAEQERDVTFVLPIQYFNITLRFLFKTTTKTQLSKK